MDERSRPTGSWIGGVRSAGADLGYPGERMGLPQEGPGSVAGYGRRLGALFIDWILSSLVAAGALAAFHLPGGDRSWITLLVFGLEVWLLTTLTGTTVGKRVLGLRVARMDGRTVGVGWSLVRTVLLLVVVPALLWDRDHRGMHDRAANTIVLRS
jgi:uncharacterized RDD family membrane protein YckC